MKNYKKWFIYFLLLSFLQVSISSCRTIKINNGVTKGKKKGWYKNQKNPHNPNSTNKNAKKHN